MKRTIAMLSIIALSIGVAQAAVEKGDTEINLSGSYSKFSSGNHNGIAGDTYKIFNIMGGYDYFITDHISGGLHVGYTDYNQGNNWNLNYWSLGARGRYHFLVDNSVVPYLGLEATYNHGLDIGTKTDDNHSPTANGRGTGWSWGPQAGVRFELSPTNDFFIEYNYLFLTGNWKDYLNVESHQLIRFGIIHQFN